jgi:thiamine-monophosphate kinase
MGGRPLYYLVSVGIPEKFPVKDVELIFDGMAQVANDFRMSLIGGDTCRSLKGFLLSLTVIGEVDHAKCVYRKGASVGDAVYVTGTFGGSALGLACLEKNMRSLETREFIKLHDDPVPRVATGAWLSASTCVSAMIDVSDGLAQDLGHIAEESGVGMTIFADKVPVPAGFEAASARCGKDRLLLALGGGEDYELAFTVRGGKIELFEKMLKVMLPTFRHEVTRIGEVTDGAGIHVVDAKGDEIPLPVKGFEHRF